MIFNDAKTIEEYWRMTRIVAYNYNYEHESEFILTTAIDSFKQLVRNIKSKRIHKPIAYYYGIISQKLHEQLYSERYEMSSEFDCYSEERHTTTTTKTLPDFSSNAELSPEGHGYHLWSMRCCTDGAKPRRNGFYVNSFHSLLLVDHSL